MSNLDQEVENQIQELNMKISKVIEDNQTIEKQVDQKYTNNVTQVEAISLLNSLDKDIVAQKSIFNASQQNVNQLTISVQNDHKIKISQAKQEISRLEFQIYNLQEEVKKAQQKTTHQRKAKLQQQIEMAEDSIQLLQKQIFQKQKVINTNTKNQQQNVSILTPISIGCAVGTVLMLLARALVDL